MKTENQSYKKFVSYLDLYYNLKPEDVEISDTPGSWRVKKLCPGGEECRHAFRIALGPCSGGRETFIYYAEHGAREKGRFVSPFREWKRQHESKSCCFYGQT